MKRTKLMNKIIGVIFNVTVIIMALIGLTIWRRHYGLVWHIIFIVALVSNVLWLIIKVREPITNRFKHKAQGK